MILGFTGTRWGASMAQLVVLRRAMTERGPSEWHHGGGGLADKQSHDMAISLGIPVVLHPPLDDRYQTVYEGTLRTCERKPYLKRNHDIVDAVEIMIATPAGFEEELRSGTWATIRYARKIKRETYIIFPDGNVAWPWREG